MVLLENLVACEKQQLGRVGLGHFAKSLLFLPSSLTLLPDLLFADLDTAAHALKSQIELRRHGQLGVLLKVLNTLDLVG